MGEKDFMRKNCSGEGQATAPDSLLPVYTKISWGPGGFQARPRLPFHMGDHAEPQGVHTYGTNLRNLASHGHIRVLSAGSGGILVASVVPSGQNFQHEGCPLCLPAFVQPFLSFPPAGPPRPGDKQPHSAHFLVCSTPKQAAGLFGPPALRDNYLLSDGKAGPEELSNWTHSHTTSKWQSQDLNPGLSGSKGQRKKRQGGRMEELPEARYG
ncbi:uncharacterized protein LOC116553475 [Sapajus apella]|uniref:Uncharacterized protein LOC116553475 n=1 Tax=Sapajus apella TaxID=9515 RepID=A0A6J3I2Q1_SAPAP|nr:uncharacterized protein LOC116553475 [Sapajus apella]